MGNRIAITDANNHTTSYAYDAQGRLRMVTDPTGAQTHSLYDERGWKVADIGPEKEVTEYLYNPAGQIVQTIRDFFVRRGYLEATVVGDLKVLDLAGLPPGQSALVTVNGEDVALFRRGDEIFAIGNECPHQGGSLSDGSVEGDIVICPLHGWEFDLRSGACMTVPGESVPRYRVTVEAGAIYIEDAP